jgi:type III pantothenate kinase
VSRVLLAINVGNTQTTIGFYRGSILLDRWRIATRVARTGDELWSFLRQFITGSGHDGEPIDAVAISSVVPELTLAYAQMSQSRLLVPALVINHSVVRSLTIDYNPPDSVGADRLCGAVAAFARFGGPLVVVDLGTATVFDVVSESAVYCGGVIAPGLQTAMESLHSRTALLPRVELAVPDHVIGTTTKEAIQSGLLYGAIDMINGMLRRIETQLGKSPVVVGTGGFAEMLKPHCPALQHVDPDLVLEGIRLISEQQ